MVRATLLILVMTGLLTFGLANTHHVGLSFIVGEMEVRLIFLLAASFASGALAALVNQLLERARRRVERKKIRVSMQRAALKQGEIE